MIPLKRQARTAREIYNDRRWRARERNDFLFGVWCAIVVAGVAFVLVSELARMVGL